jgi:hypothetical protein
MKRGRHCVTRTSWLRPLAVFAATACTLGTAALVVPRIVLGNAAAVDRPEARKAAWANTGRPPGRLNLALGRPVAGSAPCRNAEAAAKAVNGSLGGGTGDKWCSSAPVQMLTVDLGRSLALASLTVRHAQAGGEPARYNTRDFDVLASADGVAFRTLASVRANSRPVTTHVATGAARYVRINVVAGQQTGRGSARIYELEVYAAPPRPNPPPPTRAPSTRPPAKPVQGRGCFPFPPAAPRPTVTVDPDVPALDRRYTDAAEKFWQLFGANNWLGIRKLVITNDDSLWLSEGTLTIPYRGLVAAVDTGDAASWLLAGLRLMLLSPGVPGLFTDGIPETMQFAAHGDDPRRRLVDATDPRFFDAAYVWSAGGPEGARFLLWLTQHRDKRASAYTLVHDLDAAMRAGERDYAGLFVRLTGQTYAQLFAEYVRDKAINPHC